ncbi:hypothetical protein CRUP_002163 [Coryphaenoides rupestris]|nr:hypothetical protein CRUP_002163 [Coryphaenoides rupestris]
MLAQELMKMSLEAVQHQRGSRNFRPPPIWLLHSDQGYQTELQSYLRDDGSFSAFGPRDSSGSTWWGPGGEFAEAGLVVLTEMRRCRDDCPAALTAFVLMALLEDKTYADMYESTISRAAAYLERTDLANTGNYTLCLMAYALTLANRPLAVSALDRLQRNTADFSVNFIGGRERELDDTEARRAGPEWQWQAHATEVEMVSYVLLALYPQGRLFPAIPLMNGPGAGLNRDSMFPDTVVAIQALALYATFSGASAIELSIQMSTSLTEDVSNFRINSTTYLLYQSMEIVTDRDVFIDLHVDGKGFALFQGIDGVTETGMAMVEVVLLSGFILAPDAAAPVSPIMWVESANGVVSLYLNSLTLVEVCISLPLVRRYKVAHTQDATVHVYDYYEPGRGAIRAYNSKVMQAMDSCSFCGTDCSRCQVGISMFSSLNAVSMVWYRSLWSASSALSLVRSAYWPNSTMLAATHTAADSTATTHSVFIL